MNAKQMRELDAWIAEHVMDAKSFVGLKKRGYWYCPDAHGYTDRQSEAWHLTREEAKKHEYIRGDEPVVICEFDTPCYTTAPAAAMMVLEKCAEKCCVQIRKQELGQWCVWKGGILENDICGAADTLPLAICMFAEQLFKEGK